MSSEEDVAELFDGYYNDFPTTTLTIHFFLKYITVVWIQLHPITTPWLYVTMVPVPLVSSCKLLVLKGQLERGARRLCCGERL